MTSSSGVYLSQQMGHFLRGTRGDHLILSRALTASSFFDALALFSRIDLQIMKVRQGQNKSSTVIAHNA